MACWKNYPQSPHSGEYRQRSSQTKLARLKQGFKAKAIISSVKKNNYVTFFYIIAYVSTYR